MSELLFAKIRRLIVLVVALLSWAAPNAPGAVGVGGGVFIPGTGSGSSSSASSTVITLAPDTPAVESNILNNATAGSTIMFQAGKTYTNNNYLRRNLNYGVTGPGVRFWYQHYQTNMTQAGQYAIFDERGVTNGVGTTNIIDLPGADFTYITYSNAFIVDYINVLDADFNAFNTAYTAAGSLYVTNNNSVISFRARKLNTSGFQGSEGIAPIKTIGGAFVYINIEQTTNELYGVGYSDGFDGGGTNALQTFDGNSTGFFWVAGNIEMHVARLWGDAYAWHWVNTGTSVTNDCRIYPGQINGKVYGETFSVNNFRGWVIGAQEIAHLPGESSFALIQIFGGGLWYFDSQVYRCENQYLYYSHLDGTVSNSFTWINGNKSQSALGWASFANGGAEATLDIDTYQDAGGAGGTTGAFATAAGSTLTVNGGVVRTTGVAVNHAGGNALFKGVTFQNTNYATMEVSGSGLQLRDCDLTSPSGTNSIHAPSTQTVTLLGLNTFNQPVHANITTTGNGITAVGITNSGNAYGMTNLPFALTQTNFNSGQFLTNNSGHWLLVSATVTTITTNTGISASAAAYMTLYVDTAGARSLASLSNRVGCAQQGGGTQTNDWVLSGYVGPGYSYCFSNTSTGAATTNMATIKTGTGQILQLP